MRVTKPGGYVDMNEGKWIGNTPPVELVEYCTRVMAGAKFLPASGWQALLETAGLTEICVKTYKVSVFSQRLDEMKGLDAQDRLDRMRGIKSFIGLIMRSAEFRKYAKEIMPSVKIMMRLFTYSGYGLNVGRKENE